MMISPESYYDLYLKGKNEKQLLSAIRGLKNEIGHLKNVMEHPEYKNGPIIHPSKDVRISCTREYLQRAIQAYKDLGGKYIPSKAEQEANDFQDNLEYISRITFEIGGFFEGMTKYTLEFQENEVHFASSKFDVIMDEMSLNRETTIWLLSRLYIGEWRKYYDPQRFGYCVLDGTQWNVSFEYSNDKKTVEFAGSNDYPYNFNEFIGIFNLDDDMEVEDEEDDE